VLLAMDNDLEAIGTNAHELPMVAAALAKDDEELRWAPYRILDQWRHTYGGNLLIALPDAFGTKAFLRDAPELVADWTGFRHGRAGAALGPLPHPRPGAPPRRRNPPARAARRLRHQGVFARRAGRGGGLDRLPPRQRPADRGRRGHHQMVEAEGPQPEGEAPG